MCLVAGVGVSRGVLGCVIVLVGLWHGWCRFGGSCCDVWVLWSRLVAVLTVISGCCLLHGLDWLFVYWWCALVCVG